MTDTPETIREAKASAEKAWRESQAAEAKGGAA